jgi:hypothetical protein|tara:strand:- start:2193 stop:2549 length:357 start_codon:yes stop_codon:yes gene_type:complete
MTYLALDKGTGDLILPAGGGVARVTDGRFVVQQVQSKLRTFLAEWILDQKLGWLSNSDFDRNYNEASIQRRARIIILNTQGVLEIISMTTAYSNRKLNIEFSAETIYGTIDVTVPWGI